MVTSISGYFHVIANNSTIDLSLPNREIKTLKDVCFIPKLHQNILSIGQITNIKNLCIFFLKKYNIISIQKPHYIVAKGS